MHKGTVKWTDNNQNYGFIIPDDATAQNIFIHVSQFKKLGLDAPKDGQRVCFNSEDMQLRNSILTQFPSINLIQKF